MTRRKIEIKYDCSIHKDVGLDSGKSYYMVFDKEDKPLLSAYTLKEIERKLKAQSTPTAR